MKSITKEFLESEIVSVEYQRGKGTLTHCYITVKNGFTFTGESACVDEASFNQELGEKFAYENAFNQMWKPYGFWLKQFNDGLEEIAKKADIFPFGVAIAFLKAGNNVARKVWNDKSMFILIIKGEAINQAIIDQYGNPDDIPSNPPMQDAIYMKTADNKLLPWVASQEDVLAEDWYVIE